VFIVLNGSELDLKGNHISDWFISFAMFTMMLIKKVFRSTQPGYYSY